MQSTRKQMLIHWYTEVHTRYTQKECVSVSLYKHLIFWRYSWEAVYVGRLVGMRC